MKLLVSAAEAADILGVSERKFHELRHDPKFAATVKTVNLGPRCNRFRVADLQAYVDSLEPVPPVSEPAHLKGSRMPQTRELQAA
jgi:hypothetical protein